MSVHNMWWCTWLKVSPIASSLQIPSQQLTTFGVVLLVYPPNFPEGTYKRLRNNCMYM